MFSSLVTRIELVLLGFIPSMEKKGPMLRNGLTFYLTQIKAMLRAKEKMFEASL